METFEATLEKFRVTARSHGRLARMTWLCLALTLVAAIGFPFASHAQGNPPDSDGDGMSDVWEVAHSLNPNDPADAEMDPDADGMTNLEEYWLGTDPQNAVGRFALSVTSISGEYLQLAWPMPFPGVILQVANSDFGVWTDYTGTVSSPFIVPTAGVRRYFRLVFFGPGSNVYSVNIVGYIKLLIPPGLSVTSNPLSYGNNAIELLIPNPPDETEVIKQGVTNRFFTDFGWVDPNMILPPGEMIQIWNPLSTPFTNTFVGEVTSAPIILNPPRSADVLLGANTNLFVVALGSPTLNFQWRFNSNNIPGANSSILPLLNLQFTNTGDYDVVVTNLYGSTLSAAAVLTVLAPTPCISVSAGQADYPMTTPLALHVQTFDCATSNSVPNTIVAVYVNTGGTMRTNFVTTDSGGQATVYFQPLAGEAGHYAVSAGLPNQPGLPAQSSFAIVGVGFSTNHVAHRLIVGVPVTNHVALRNLTDVPLTGIAVTLLNTPSGVTFQAWTPPTLEAYGTNALTYVLKATAGGPDPISQLHVTSAEGATNDLPVTIEIVPPVPQLVATPAWLHTAMLRGAQSVVTFQVANVGGAASGDLEVLLPEPEPEWLGLVTPAIIPSLAPEAQTLVSLSLTPSNTLPLLHYPGSIGLWSAAAGQTNVPFQFDCESTLKGNLRVTVVDEFTYYATNAPKVTNATVTLLDPYVHTNIVSAPTDTNGVVLFTNLSEDYYEVSVQATQHGSFGTVVLVSGNQTFDLAAFLAREMVSYRWIVTTQAITDRYLFTLDTRFETELPAPVIRMEPGGLDLCDYPAATNVVNLTIFNSGLIAAKSARLVFGTHPNFIITPLSEELGDIPGQANVVVPVVIRRLGTNDGPSQIEAHLDWQLATGIGTRYYRFNLPVWNAGLLDCDPPAGYHGSGPLPPPPRSDDFSGGPPGSGGSGDGDGDDGGPPGSGPRRPHIYPPPMFVTPTNDIVRVQLGIQLSHSAVMVRTVIGALLQIVNGSTDGFTNLGVVLDIRDTNGVAANNLFGIRPPELTGLDAVDGTGNLNAGASGQAKWIIIPATNAAPTIPTRYTIGGTLTYRQAGQTIQIPLFPVPVIVFPDAHLEVDYFWEQIVYSDDPITPEVELPVTFGVGLHMKNVGFGNALNVQVTSAQPQIVDNASGLPVKFQLLGSQVNTQSFTSALTAFLGKISPGSNAVATWWMTASLQGRFINYSAAFEHLDDLGNKNLSLVDSIAIHPMIHVVRADVPTDDAIPDYLVDDDGDTNRLADRLYLSDGSNVPVMSVTNASLDAPPGPSHTNVLLTFLPTTDWGYLRITNPNPGSMLLTFVRRSDGRILMLGSNVWTTHRIVHPLDSDPYREDFLHLLDFNSTGLYTLGYNIAPVAPAITSPPVNLTNVVGTTAIFVVDATGTEPLAYQWFKDEALLLGSTAPILTLTNVQPDNAGIYKVVVSNAGGTTNASATLKVRTPPTIDPVADQFVIVGQQLVITNHVSHPDGPIIFSLGPNAPAGAIITTNGIFKWAPTCAQGSSTNTNTIWATDSGTPPLSNSITFTITVPECIEAGLGSTVMQIGHTSSVPIRLLSTVALTNMAFTVVYPPERLTNFAVTVNSPQVVTQWVQESGAGNLGVSFTLSSGSVLHGPTNVGQLSFTALSNQSSAFVPLPVADVVGLKLDGTLAANAYGQAGRVVIVGREPLLEAWLGTNSQRMLTLYGKPGMTYEIRYTTNVSTPSPWTPAWTNTVPVSLFYNQVLQGIFSNAPVLFLRANEE